MGVYSFFSRSLTLVAFLFVQGAALPVLAQTSSFHITTPSVSERQLAISALEPSDQAILDLTIKKATPVFIFIPGILGSRLSRQSNGQDVPFWGTLAIADLVRDNPAFKYTEGESVTAKVLDKFYLPLGRDIDVYGSAYNELSLIMGPPENVLRFAYDWRQSNVLSARDFSRWLCSEGVQSVVKDRPVVLLAHSMGGLILKYWLEHSYDADHCAPDGAVFSSWMPIQKIVFAGTPNYGAPKAVLAFSQGQTLFVDPENDGAIWKALMAIDMHTLSRNLNAYGIRYPSAYQLLPIVNTTRACMNNPAWRTDLEFRTQNDVQANIDLFDAPTWKLLGWPAQLSPADRESFIKDELPSLLSQAKAFLCDVAKYDVDKIFDGKVVHFSGFDQKTVCKIVFMPPAYSGEFIAGKCEGDGTVPYWIAADTYHLKAGQPNDRQPHAALMAAKEFSLFLGQLHNELYANLILKASDLEGGTEAVVKLFAQLRYLPPSNPQLPTQQTALIRNVADRVVAQLDLSPKDDILRIADDRTRQASDRVNAMLVYANLSDVTKRQRAWAFNNAAHINLTNQLFSQSFELSKRAIDYADNVLASDPKLNGEMRDLKSKAALTAAIASAQLGDQPVAHELQKLAIENGSKKALNLNLPLSVSIAKGPSTAR